MPAFFIFVSFLLVGKSRLNPQSLPVVLRPATPEPPVVYKEKEIVREVVKVPCEYCETLVDATAQRCPSCGAPLGLH